MPPDHSAMIRFNKQKRLLLTIALMLGLGREALASPNLDLARQLNQAFVEVAEKVSPSVVVILVKEKPGTRHNETEDDYGAGPQDSAPRGHSRQFSRPKSDIPPPNDDSQVQGSGVILRKDGYILTNHHVVENAAQIQVRLLDGRTFKGKLRGTDPASDLAVIKIEGENLPAAKLGDSAKTRVGEFAIAIGAPFDFEYSVTFGHVSAKGRSNVVPYTEGGGGLDQDFLQTDASINPGNSGGPLLNIDGEVIGINTLIEGLHTGIGFAIPSNLAGEISEQLIARGKFSRAWLGVEIHAVRDDTDFHELVGGVDEGVIVKSILPDSPASQSGLHPGDVITALNGRRLFTAQQLRDEVRHKGIGHSLTLEVFRGGKTLSVRIKPVEYVDPAQPAVADASTGENASSGLGITVHALTRELADQFRVELTRGLIVVAVDRNGAAARCDIQPGDIVTEINRQPATTPSQFRELVKRSDLKRGVILNLVSRDSSRFEILKQNSE